MRLRPFVEERAEIMRDSYRLLPAFVWRRISEATRQKFGGADALVADLGLCYCQAVSTWFTSSRRRKIALSTWVWNNLLWGLSQLHREHRIIHAHDSPMQSEPHNAHRRQSQRVRHFHGREGWCDDSALLAHPPDIITDIDVTGATARALKFLPWRAREVIKYRFYAGLTLDETGRKLGVSRERVRQIEHTALRKLRPWLTRIYREMNPHLDVPLYT